MPLLSKEERKTLTPAEKKALRKERRAERRAERGPRTNRKAQGWEVRSYPRIGQTQKKPKNTQAKCQCGEIGKFRVHVQFDYMRGNDEVYWACQNHRGDVGFLTGTQD